MGECVDVCGWIHGWIYILCIRYINAVYIIGRTSLCMNI